MSYTRHALERIRKQSNYLPYVRIIIVFFLVASVWMNKASGQEKSPQRGFQPGNSYSLSQIETINTTNGNLMLNFPLGQLPPGRGTLSGGISLRYNSKIYDSDVAELPDDSNQLCLQNM